MGWLDDHAKRRIVELRRAGLSFRKMKKVLELDNIHVTPQAVHLFLKRKSVEPRLAAAAWDRDQPQLPLRGQEPKLPRLAGPWPPAVPGRDPLVSWGPAAGPNTKEGTQSVSPASLCQGSGQSSEALPMGLPPQEWRWQLHRCPLGSRDHGQNSPAPAQPRAAKCTPSQEPSPDGEEAAYGQDDPPAEKGQR